MAVAMAKRSSTVRTSGTVENVTVRLAAIDPPSIPPRLKITTRG
jgi:hypothetical protein